MAIGPTRRHPSFARSTGSRRHRFAAVRRSVMVAHIVRRLVPIACGCLLLGTTARAQTVGASLQGIVTDSSGAALPNAEVIVLSVATGATRELKTDGTGHYRIPVLQPGDYELHISLTG